MYLNKTKINLWRLAVGLWLMAFGVLLSCGSRKVSIAKQDLEVVKQGEKTEQTTTESMASFSMKKDFNLSESINNVEFIHIREYYESGVLKSEKRENRKAKQEITTANQDVLQGNSSKIETAQKAEKQKERTTLKTKEKETHREAYPWYWWVIGAVIVWEFLRILWKNYFKYLIKIR